jgi:hypothetical protein
VGNVSELIKSREDAFFRDAYKGKELSKHHPLMHLISTYRKLKDLNGIQLSDEEMVRCVATGLRCMHLCHLSSPPPKPPTADIPNRRRHA